MARIRTIKPDFWTDEKLTECSLSARLFFIGLLNFADDNGNLQRSSKKLKMQIFPADMIDCETLVIELTTHGVLTEYSVNGEKYLHIKGFKKHQVINRPSKSSIPEPSLTDDSVSAQAPVNEESLTEGKGREGKGRELTTLVDGKPSTPPCPHEEIIELYHEHCPTLASVKVWHETRRKHLQARWREDPKRQNLGYWERFFQYVAQSDFLTGNPGPWKADLEWLVNASNFVKVIEGKYHAEVAA